MVSAQGRLGNLGKMGVVGGVCPHAYPFCHLFLARAEQSRLMFVKDPAGRMLVRLGDPGGLFASLDCIVEVSSG
jgi:hypothetical protein